jgi:hypothetical protein
MPMKLHSDQQFPLNSKTYNSLMRPNPPNAILEAFVGAGSLMPAKLHSDQQFR